MTLISLRSEAIGYNGEAVLKNVSLTIEEGETIVFVGESGAGKSTLLAHLNRLCGSRSALIPQELGLADNLSVFHNVYMGRLDRYSFLTNLRNLVWPADPFVGDIRQTLRTLSLEEKMPDLPTELSGGQRQRVAIGRALFKSADILIADEPVSALDEKLGRDVLDILVGAHKTTLLALHDVEAARHIGDRLVGLKEGRLVFDKPPNQVSSAELQDLYERG